MIVKILFMVFLLHEHKCLSGNPRAELMVKNRRALGTNKADEGDSSSIPELISD